MCNDLLNGKCQIVSHENKMIINADICRGPFSNISPGPTIVLKMVWGIVHFVTCLLMIEIGIVFLILINVSYVLGK